MTGEIAPSGPSERSAVWVPYVVRRAERTFCGRRHAGGSFRRPVGLRSCSALLDRAIRHIKSCVRAPHLKD